MDELWNMRGINLFNGLTGDEIEEVLKLAPPKSYRKGEFIFFTGDAADALFLLQLGTVKVSYVTLNGDEKILNIFRPGDIFGELFLGKYRHRVGEAQALDDVIVCKMCEETFLSLVQRLPQVALNFIRHLADGQREMMARAHSLMRADAKYRLSGILLSMARRYCCTESGSYPRCQDHGSTKISSKADDGVKPISTHRQAHGSPGFGAGGHGCRR